MTKADEPRTPWRAEDGLRIVAAIALLTVLEQGVLATPFLRGLEGPPLLAARAAVVTAFYGSILGILAWYARGEGARLLDAVALRGRPDRRGLLGAVVVAVAAVAFEAAFIIIAPRIGLRFQPTRDAVEFFGATPEGMVALVVLGVLIAPVVEEMAFRGAVLPGMQERWGSTVAVLGSALLFSAVHFNPGALVPFAVLGVLLGVLRVRYRSLWPPVVGHVLFNAGALAFSLFGP